MRMNDIFSATRWCAYFEIPEEEIVIHQSEGIEDVKLGLQKSEMNLVD